MTVEHKNASGPSEDEAGASETGPELSVVIPVFNEGKELSGLVTEIAAGLGEIPGLASFEIILCDDGSSDDTWAVVDALSQSDSRVEGLSLSRNFGKEMAVIAGLSAARGRAAVVMDGDGQHPPGLIPDLVRAWREGADVVEAVKTGRPDQSWLVRMAARLFNRSFSTLTGVNLTNATDFRLLARPVIDELVDMPERSVFFRGLSTWLGYRREVIEFEPLPRGSGHTRWTLWGLTRFAVRNLISFTSAPLHLVTAIGLIFAAFAAVLALQTLYNWFAGHAVEGFTTVILLLLVQGSVILVGLGVIGLYVSEIHKEVKRRPRYVVARRTSGLQ
ncbi:MAG: glycosyltransferase [Gammaproteobacteria bacterium]|jgi:glycosyltransferase involved in cell wall biosynthesis|nr:glycosyltransferase [Gammaproteobacteria bacterium]